MTSPSDPTGAADDCTGRYALAGAPGLEVTRARGDRELHLRFPGAPDWLDSRLEPCEDDGFVARGGALRGFRIRFARGEDGRALRLELVDRLTLPRRPGEGAPAYAFIEDAPPDPERDAAFDALFARTIEGGSGAVVEYDLPYPKHAFLDSLCRRRGLLLHGSRNADIERFEPRAETLGPTRERSLLGVSACADGIWPIPYAILDRTRARGAFHNGVLELREGGRAGRIYHFSIHEGHLARAPSVFVDGMVYVLPADGFRRVTDGPIGFASLEFVCESPVSPLARLGVSRRDLPVPICGHDDSRVLAALDFVDRMYVECLEAEQLDDGCRLRFEPRAGLDADLARLGGIFGTFYPWTRIDVDAESLRITGSSGLGARISRGFSRARERHSPGRRL